MFAPLKQLFGITPSATRTKSHLRRDRVRSQLTVESLEHRRVLAASGTLFPAITGTIFQDLNGDGNASAGEGVNGASLLLFTDDGDGVFEPGGDDLQSDSTTTDSSGVYCFDNLDSATGYFVVQSEQTTAEGIILSEGISNLMTPGTPDVIIDRFETTQTGAEANPPVGSTGSSTVELAPPPDEIVGLERDLFVVLDGGSGAIDATVNEFGDTFSLRVNADVNVTGRATATWDGVDNDAGNLAFGLGGIDLTNGGTNTGISLRIGARDAGSSARMRLYKTDASTFAETTFTIPATSTGIAEAYVFLPFADFSTGASATDVDAIELLIDSNGVAANNVEVDVIGANGPKQLNFANSPVVDLEITKTDNQTTAVPGEQVTYIITAQNNGPIDVTGATVTDTFPSELVNVTYTSVANDSATGNTVSGSGNINDTVNLPVSSSIVYTASGTLSPSATGTLSNTATITVPSGFVDSNTDNNTATDDDTLDPQVDLVVSKTDNLTTVTPGDTVTYTIVVTNDGPSDVTGAVVADTLPAELENVSYTSTTTGTVSGNTASGSGDINDTVNMAADSTITYTVSGTVASSATGTLSNTVTVTSPSGVLELDLDNNSATDPDDIDATFDLEITKTDNVTEVSPNDNVTYTIVVTNNGPSDVTGATVTDEFPDELTNVTYASTTTGTVSGNTSGSGDINDVVNIASGSSITYTASATVDSSASGTIDNTATVTAADPTNETDSTNNSANDVDTVNPDFDLSVTKTDNVTSVISGGTTSYTIVVANSGPSDVSSVSVTDNFPSEITSVSYTSSASGGASGHTTSGSGDINDSVDLPSGSSVTYTAVATIDSNASGTLSNTVTVDAPVGVTEADTSNNSATDIDTIEEQVDLEITKTDNTTTLSPGESTTYTIVVSNNGPADVTGATVTDSFPTDFSTVTYTSSASGGASGNTVAGSGDINDSVNLPSGSSITYTASATLADVVNGTIVNTATVTAPSGVSETDFANNSATDTDIIDITVRSISGSVYVDIDENGERTGLEPPIPGVLITLNGIDNLGTPVVRSVTTDGAGEYEFLNLLPGTYTIRETQPFGFIDGEESIGTGQTTDPTVTDDVFANLVLGSDDNAVDFDFGEIRPQGTKRRLLASSFSA